MKLVRYKQDGRCEYHWKTSEPHDYLDSTAQAFAIAGSQGLRGLNIVADKISPNRQTRKLPKKCRIRII